MALKSFGFEARQILGRVHVSGQPGGRSHQSTLVNFGDDIWLVDAGFGAESPRTPIPLIPNKVVSLEGISYRIIKSEMLGYKLQNKTKNDWKNLYSFDLSPVLDIDLNLGNHITSTSPVSFFMTTLIAAIPVENGVKTLYNDRLKKTINGKEEIILFEDNATYLKQIEKEFGIQLDAEYSDLKPINLYLFSKFYKTSYICKVFRTSIEVPTECSHHGGKIIRTVVKINANFHFFRNTNKSLLTI